MANYTDQEKMEIYNKAMDCADSLVQTTVEGSKDLPEMNKNLLILKTACLKILGSFIFNEEKQGGIDPEVSLSDLVHDVRQFYDATKENFSEAEFLQPKNLNEGKH